MILKVNKVRGTLFIKFFIVVPLVVDSYITSSLIIVIFPLYNTLNSSNKEKPIPRANSFCLVEFPLSKAHFKAS